MRTSLRILLIAFVLVIGSLTQINSGFANSGEEKEFLPCLNTTDIHQPATANNNSNSEPFGCVQRSEVGKDFTLLLFVQVYCGACKELVSLMPQINSRLGKNTTVRVVVLDKYSEITQNYANQPSLKDVFVANDKIGTSNFIKDFGIKYTPSLILLNSSNEEVYRGPLRGERRGASMSDINTVATLTKNE